MRGPRAGRGVLDAPGPEGSPARAGATLPGRAGGTEADLGHVGRALLSTVSPKGGGCDGGGPPSEPREQAAYVALTEVIRLHPRPG